MATTLKVTLNEECTVDGINYSGSRTINIKFGNIFIYIFYNLINLKELFKT